MYHCIILLPLPPIFWKLPSIICKQSTCTSCLSIKHWLLVHYYHLNNNINLFLTALQLDRPVPRYKEDTETFIDHVQLWSATTRNHRCTFLSWLWFLVVYPRTLHNTMHVQSAPYFYCLYIYQTTFTKQHSMFHLLRDKMATAHQQHVKWKRAVTVILSPTHGPQFFGSPPATRSQTLWNNCLSNLNLIWHVK